MSISDTIIYGSLSDLEIQLRLQPNLNFIDAYGFTPLIQTAIMNDMDKGELLLDSGADVNLKDLTGSSALHWTVENSNLPFCRLLLNYGADPNAYTLASQPVLVKPTLRRQKNLRNLLTSVGANSEFSQDYINTKLLGHRYELSGFADIVDPKQKFIEVDFEGFILEFTIGVVLDSLKEYRNNFSARHLRPYFESISQVIKAFAVADQLIHYQQYQVNHNAHKAAIDSLLDHEMLIIPVSYEGHAISWIKYGNLLAKCDRSHNDLFVDNVVIYKVTRPQILTKEFIKQAIFKRQTKEFIDIEVPNLLGLKPLDKLMIGSQISGNCSWANIESVVPVIWYLYAMHEQENANRHALSFYYQWLEWDKERALQFCLKSFEPADPARRASKAAILGAILFQRCSANVAIDIERAMRIIKVLKTPGYEYVLQSYTEIYCFRNPCPAGENLQKLLQLSQNHF